VKAFRATLEEVTEAARVLHVVDASSPTAAEQTAHVLEVLAEIGASGISQILLMNKMDRIPEADADPAALARRLLGESGSQPAARAVGISAMTGDGIDRLLAMIDDALGLDPVSRTTLTLPAGDGATLAMLHEFGRVLSTRYHEETGEVEVEVELPESAKRRLERAADER
jgi:GTP-binding protein HflX